MELSLQALWELMQNGGRPPPMPPEGFTGLADAGTVPAQNGRPARVIMNTASPQAAPEASYDPMTGARIGADTGLKRPNWFMEPDLHGYQTGKVDLPYGAVQNEAGGAYYPDTGEELQMVRRPGVIPLTSTPDGLTLAMPKMADLAGYLVGGAVPLKGGEVALGAGAVRRAKPPVEPPPPIGHNGPPPEMSLSGLPTAIEQGAVVDPVQAARKAIQERYGAIGSHVDEQALTINNILDEAYAGPVKSRARNVSDIGGDLHAAGSDALRKLGVEEGKIDFKTATPHQDEIVSRAVASEIMAALKRGGKTAADWYTKAVQEAMGHAEAIHPELANDPLQKMGFTAALAITSQGEKVRSNVRLSEVAYDHFKKTGRFPTNINAKAGAAMNENFGKLNELLDTIGPEATMKFLHTEYTVKELQQLGHEVGGENMGAKVYGSSIFGPKIGQGFFQNLNGNYNPVTMDLWFMRGMGRLTGTLSGKPDLTKQTQRFASALEKEGIPVPSTIEEMSKLADDMVLTHERDFRTNRAAYDSGDKTRSELSYAAERLQAGLSGLNETPTGGGHRQWLRDRVQRAKELLKEHGHDLTAADMQAIWWYPEKDLYGKLGGLPSEGINTDYATVYRELRGKHGKP